MLGIEAITYPSGFSSSLVSSSTLQGFRKCSKTSPNTAISNFVSAKTSFKLTKSKSATITFSQYFSAILAAFALISIPVTRQPLLLTNRAK